MAAKKIIKYRGGQLPEDLSGILANADENDLRILIALMMAADDGGVISEEVSVSDALGLDKSEVNASVKFWRGAGIIGGSAASGRTKKKEPAQKAENPGDSGLSAQGSDNMAAEGKPAIATAHRNGVVESGNDISSYGSGELADLFERRRISAEFMDEAQRVYGKTFNSYEMGIVAGMIDRLDLSEEAVLAILAYVASLGRKPLRYAEKVAIALYDDGYTTAREIVERIAVLERSKELIYKIKHLFGAGGRELSRSERTMFEKWTQRFGYEMDVIRLAYDITVDATHEPAPKYANAILENWYNAGLRTAADVEAFLEAQKAKKEEKSKGEDGKSYDLEDFFEAALQRSFEDLK